MPVDTSIPVRYEGSVLTNSLKNVEPVNAPTCPALVSVL